MGNYDIDKDLNKLLNEPGMDDALKKLERRIFCSRLLGYIPIAILVAGTYFSTFYMQCSSPLASIAIFAVMLILSFEVSYVIKKWLDKRVIKRVSSISEKIYQKMNKERYCYNWEYLTYILENRIQQSEHQNDVFKKTITIVLTLLGIKALYSKVNLWNLIFENTKLSFQSALLPAVRIGILLLVVSVFIETYDCLINNSVKLEKWYVLLNHANKLKIESKRSQN